MSEPLNLQRFLDGVVHAFRTRSFDAFEARIALPLTVFSYEGTAIVTRTSDLQRFFETYLASLDAHGISDQRRMATSFYQIGPQLASCTYDTTFLREGKPALPPFASAVTLRLTEGGWRAVSLMSSIPQARSWFRDHAVEAEDDAMTDRRAG